MSLFNKFRDFDVYTKPLDDFRVKTSFGGMITLISMIVIVTLFITETWAFFNIDVDEQLFVDSTSADMRVDIHFDVTFPKVPCTFMTIDVMDVSGETQNGVEDNIFKLRLDQNGNNLTSNPEKQDAWVQKLKGSAGEGCRIFGKVQVAKVGGNFHIAPGAPLTSHRSHFHDLHSLSPGSFNTSHTIHHLSFGQPYPGKTYPLDERTFISEKGGIMHQYYLKVVPTMFVYTVTDHGREEFSHQFSITRNQKDVLAGASGLPGFFVQYEFSPLMVKYEEKRKSLSHFLVSLCAIIGGVYTVASLVDSFIYNSSRVVQKKIQMNKFT
uniref:Endoplasmic reticulum-Golgi intermediate compartment protein 3 n=1 Tax=Acrobeloides nanus TaxID=290746 RepID=A0A914DI00_9BILA